MVEKGAKEQNKCKKTYHRMGRMHQSKERKRDRQDQVKVGGRVGQKMVQSYLFRRGRRGKEKMLLGGRVGQKMVQANLTRRERRGQEQMQLIENS